MALISKKNNAFSKVATVGGIDASTNPVTFAVTTGDGAKFPSSNFKITIDNEILLCTSRTGDSLTCSRNQESTSIAAHSQNADVEVRITAGTLEEYDAVLKAASQSSEADNILLKEQASTPTTPSAGYGKIYKKTDGLLYQLNSAGAEVGLSGMLSASQYAPSGFLINGKIVPSVASNNLTVAIKGMDGNDPSASNPVYVRIGDTVRSITSALSVTKNAGTNWFNSGGAELATKEVDYFVYLGYNATDGVTIGFSRIPYANLYSDFSATSTNSLYCAISTITNAAAGDNYTNIGRFAATLSAGAGYTWTVPTFTAKNLIQRPIYETRELDFTTVKDTIGGAYTNAPTTNFAKYRLVMAKCFGNMSHTHSASTVGGSGRTRYTLPFVSARVISGKGGYNDSDFTERSIVIASNLLIDNKYDGTYGVSSSHTHLHNFEIPLT